MDSKCFDVSCSLNFIDNSLIYGVDMRVETFVLDYLRKTKNKRLTTEILKESFVDTFHVGDSFLYQGEESVIIGFDVFGAWLVN